jgi:TonB family protein
MGYQALLFCPDEKLARVVSQVFGELDFIIEPVHEPFAAVKKLMAQRFDAVVVDCENEQNASLLFKSARNSSFNQSSLAIALVEGQAGVAKAYRIGANLVLTKPINVEQAKGTLRVARGLLRKNSDAAGAGAGSAPAPAKVATASTTTPTPTTAMSNSIPAPNRTATASAPPPSRPEPPVFETPLPAMAASVKSPEKIAEKIIERPAAPQPIALASRPSAETETQPSQVSPNDNVFRNAAPNTATPALASNSVFPSASGSAAAPAPAKEVAAPFVDASKPPAPEPATPFSSSPVSVSPAQASPSHEIAPNPTPAQVSVLGSAPTFGSMGASDTPSFGTLGEEDSEASGRKKKMMIAAAIVLAVAVLGYIGYGMLGKSAEPAPTPQPVSAPQNSSQPAPAILPMSAPSNSPATGTPARSSATTQPVTSKPTIVASLDKVQAAAGSPTRIAIDPQPANGLEPKKPVSAPIVVKSNLAGTKTQVAGDDAAPVLTEVASANDNKLTGLMSSTTASLSQPSLATLRISQGVSQGLVIKRVQPKYPAAALAVHAQGAVLIEATISKDGSVLNPKVLKGDAVLARAAVEAVRQWRYKPYYLDGAPVEIQTQITVNFKAN